VCECRAGMAGRLKVVRTGVAFSPPVQAVAWVNAPGVRVNPRPHEKGMLRPGMYVHAKLTVEFPAGWAVPMAAIRKINDEKIIYLNE
jgi:hypothetical protein